MSHDGHPMRRRQRLAAYAAMLFFGVPSIVIAVVGGEAWPLLDYRMYSDSKTSAEVDWLELVGRTSEGTALRLDNEAFIVPFSYSELLRSLYSLDVLGEVDPAPARRALSGLLAAYETQRRLGEHNGPALERVEVYRLRWAGRPGAANFHEPGSRTLLQSVALPASMR